MASVKYDNGILGEFVLPVIWEENIIDIQEYKQVVDQETALIAEKVRKLRQTLNSLNEEIKNLEKEHQGQVDYASSQKRLVNVRV